MQMRVGSAIRSVGVSLCDEHQLIDSVGTTRDLISQQVTSLCRTGQLRAFDDWCWKNSIAEE